MVNLPKFFPAKNSCYTVLRTAECHDEHLIQVMQIIPILSLLSHSITTYHMAGKLNEKFDLKVWCTLHHLWNQCPSILIFQMLNIFLTAINSSDEHHILSYILSIVISVIISSHIVSTCAVNMNCLVTQSFFG